MSTTKPVKPPSILQNNYFACTGIIKAPVLSLKELGKLIFSDFKSKHLEQLLLESVEAEEVSLANQ